MKTKELENEILEEYNNSKRQLDYHLEKLLSPNSTKEKEEHEYMKIIHESQMKQLKQWLILLSEDNFKEIYKEFENLKRKMNSNR